MCNWLTSLGQLWRPGMFVPWQCCYGCAYQYSKGWYTEYATMNHHGIFYQFYKFNYQGCRLAKTSINGNPEKFEIYPNLTEDENFTIIVTSFSTLEIFRSAYLRLKRRRYSHRLVWLQVRIILIQNFKGYLCC